MDPTDILQSLPTPHVVAEWSSNHKLAVACIFWALTTAFNYFARPRTPEEWAKLSANPRWCAFVHFMAGTFTDPSKTIDGIRRFVTGKGF